MSDQLMFSIFPYVAMIVATFVPMARYRSERFKFTSLSSQFLEGRTLFWGSVPWHIGIIGVMTGHLIGFLVPAKVLAFNSVPLRLIILEVTGLAFAILAFVGLALLIVRRLSNKRVQVVSSTSDYVVLVVLLVQVISGIGIAVAYRWGSNWYAASMVPYLRSVFIYFKPNLGYVASMPWLVKLHILNAYLFLLLIPFTRFIHFLVVPLQYLTRSWQVVRWNWDPTKSRKN